MHVFDLTTGNDYSVSSTPANDTDLQTHQTNLIEGYIHEDPVFLPEEAQDEKVSYMHTELPHEDKALLGEM